MAIDQLKQKLQAKGEGENVSFWFVRHGQSEGNALGDTCPVTHDTLLTEEGRREVERVVAHLKKNGVNVTDVYTSPQGRSHQTAEMLAAAFNLPVKVKEGLRERNWGEWGELQWADVSKRLEELTIMERYTFVPKDGESWEQMEMRLIETLEEIADENAAGENVLIVMHQGGLRAILPILAKAGKEKHEEFSVPTGALSKFSFNNDTFDFVGFVPKALALFVSLTAGVAHWL
jgi:broad specificity phosphatase PhoE